MFQDRLYKVDRTDCIHSETTYLALLVMGLTLPIMQVGPSATCVDPDFYWIVGSALRCAPRVVPLCDLAVVVVPLDPSANLQLGDTIVVFPDVDIGIVAELENNLYRPRQGHTKGQPNRLPHDAVIRKLQLGEIRSERSLEFEKIHA
jgi:hypothetical protein